MTMPVTRSAVVIVRNEELNLPGLLDNLLDWIDEVVLIDDGSTDKTGQIARDAGPKVRLIDHPMIPEKGFAGQRNAGIETATSEWLLHLDCDERISSELRAEIVAKTENTELNAMRYTRLNYFMHRPMRYGGWASWNRPQIARKGMHHFTGLVHETCVIEGGDAATGQLNALMHHLNDHDFAQRLAKSTQYSQMEADKLIERAETVRPASLLTKPLREFVKKYVVQQGFRDGVPGLVAALHGATSIFRIRALAWDHQNAIPREKLEQPFRKSEF